MNDMLGPPERWGPLERAQAASRALAEAARRARFSSRARGAYQKTGFESRRNERMMRVIRIALLVLVVAIPNTVSLLYFSLLASDQYISEAKFTVSSGAIPKMDGFGSVTGLPPLAIIQDTLVITSYIESRAIVEHLNREMGLEDLYSASSIDWWARFDKSKPIEKFVSYWEKMARINITQPAAVVTLELRAFTAQDAKNIASAVIAQCEALVNSLNERMRRDTVRAAEEQLQQAGDALREARLKMEQVRNAEGLVDIKQATTAISQLLTEQEGLLLRAQTEYQSKRAYLDDTAPQVRPLKERIAALTAQVETLKQQITQKAGEALSSHAEKALSGKMTEFSTLELQQQVAEKRYAAASMALTQARNLSDQKMLYLHQIAAPALPQEARYPKRQLNIGLIFAGSIALWFVSVGLASFVRNHMA
jgi:capsular polysaccharide transport system permease protein